MTRENAQIVVKLMNKIEDVELAMDEVEGNDVLAETGYTEICLKPLTDKHTELLSQLEELKFEEA